MKKKVKKIMALIILAIMVLTLVPITNVLAETDPKPEFVMVHNLVMKRNEDSTLDVTVNEKLKFTNFQANLDYDEDAIEITGIEGGEILPNNAEIQSTSTGNKITGFEITSTNGEPIEINAGLIMKINVKTKDDAKLGKYEIAWNRAELLSDDSKIINITTIPGSIIVTDEGTDIEKAEFDMICNEKMYPGEEQTISVTSDDKMKIHYIQALFLYDENIEIVDVENGKDLPKDTEISVIRNSTLGPIVGFSIQSDNVININPNCELARITIKTDITATPEKAEFAIDWNYILNQDWKEVFADDTIANIEITPQVTIPTIENAYIRIDENELMVGEEEQVQIVVEPEEAANLIDKIEYSSSDPDIATVNEKGIIRAITAGKVRIKAVINNQFVSEAEITVTNPDIPNTGDMSITLFISMMAISLVGIISITIVNKKNINN